MTKPLLATYVINKSIPMLSTDDIRRLDVIYFAFVRVDGKNSDISGLTNINRMSEIRQINPNIKIILSAASGTKGGFAAAVQNEETLKLCVKNLVSLVKEYDFDGLDIDWEFPSNDIERHGHTILLKEIRHQLDLAENSKHLQLSIAAGSKQWYFEITELSNSIQHLDYVNLMTYDVNAKNYYTVHHTCTYPMKTDKEYQGSVKENVDVFVKNGVPAEKLIVGAAFYSRQWENVKNENNGLFAFAGEASIYGPNITQLKRDYINKNGYVRYWDDAAKAPYLFNGNNFITYDDDESLIHKCRYVKSAEIAGIMIWEYGCDEEHTLVKVMRDAIDN